MFGLCFLLAACAASPDAREAPAEPAVGNSLATHNVVLVTLDGVRTQELFGGLDALLADHAQLGDYSEMAEVRARYDAATPEARRQLLWPNLWGRLAPLGQVRGNHALGNRFTIQNTVAWSSPGYVEILSGEPRAEVVDNAIRWYPWITSMEYARTALDLEYQQVAMIGSWDGFNTAAASRPDAFLMLGVRDAVPAPYNAAEMDLVAELRAEVMGLWEEGTDQYLTWRIARPYIVKNQPRVLWLALGNSDDWAHADRYDRYLDTLHQQDRILGELWDLLQTLDAYRDRTSLIITTDHGRGLTPSDWVEHDISIPGSSDVWVAVIGPDTPDQGELRTPEHAMLGQVSATLLQLLGLDYRAWNPDARPPLAGAVP